MTKDVVLKHVEEAFILAEIFYKRSFSRPDEIIFKRSGTAAGYCFHSPTKKTLMFQLDFMDAYPEDALDTIRHEVAHYIQFEYYSYRGYKIQPHGWEWQYVMRNVMGMEPKRCHSYDTSVTKVKRQVRHEYSCKCGLKHDVSTTIHNKILKGKGRICSRCRGRLYLVKEGVKGEKTPDDILKEIERLKKQIQDLS